MEIDEDPHSSQDHIVHSTFPIRWVVQYDGTSYAATDVPDDVEVDLCEE